MITDEQAPYLVALSTAVLLLVSEILGLSSCKANSIIELYKILPGNSCMKKPSREEEV
jgi:hypothetical protein